MFKENKFLITKRSLDIIEEIIKLNSALIIIFFLYFRS